MFKTIGKRVCAFDLEWVPDPQAGRRVYGLPADMPDAEVFQTMWAASGATPEKPRPYLKTVLCRVVSVSAVIRETVSDDDVRLRLSVLPKQTDAPMAEGELIATFLNYVGKTKPQLVGFNSLTSDLPILLQRGIAAGITATHFCQRPQKPWEGVDYFARHSEAHVDLKDVVSGWGIGTPSLHEFASVMGVPGKMGTDGSSVVDLWVAGQIQDIVEYNQFDALTTYLVWLKTARFAGFFSPEQAVVEEARLRALLLDKIDQGELHLARYLERWDSFQSEQADNVALGLSTQPSRLKVA